MVPRPEYKPRVAMLGVLAEVQGSWYFATDLSRISSGGPAVLLLARAGCIVTGKGWRPCSNG